MASPLGIFSEEEPSRGIQSLAAPFQAEASRDLETRRQQKLLLMQAALQQQAAERQSGAIPSAERFLSLPSATQSRLAGPPTLPISTPELFAARNAGVQAAVPPSPPGRPDLTYLLRPPEAATAGQAGLESALRAPRAALAADIPGRALYERAVPAMELVQKQREQEELLGIKGGTAARIAQMKLDARNKEVGAYFSAMSKTRPQMLALHRQASLSGGGKPRPVDMDAVELATHYRGASENPGIAPDIIIAHDTFQNVPVNVALPIVEEAIVVAEDPAVRAYLTTLRNWYRKNKNGFLKDVLGLAQPYLE